MAQGFSFLPCPAQQFGAICLMKYEDNHPNEVWKRGAVGWHMFDLFMSEKALFGIA